jgi:uncharacterized membrane protein (UPF0182 family)
MPRRYGRLLGGSAIALLLIAVFSRSGAVFYTDLLWYDSLSQSSVFWTRLFTGVVVRLVTGALGAALILLNLWYVLRQLGPVHLRRRYGNLEIAEQVPRSYLIGGAVVVAVLAGWWLSSLLFGGDTAVSVLAWLRAEAWGVRDPLFGHDISFYIFSLPIWIRLLEFLLIVLIWSVLLIGVGYALVGAVRVRGTRWEIDDRPRVHFAVLIASMLIVFGVRYLLSRYELLLDGGGFGTIGYTDVHARLPARLVLGLLSIVAGAALIYGALRRTWAPPIVAFGVFLLAALGMGLVYPAIVQKVQVEPNELAREAEYIGWHMEFTRRAYGLEDMERRSFRYRRADAATWAEMAPMLERLPLWDLPQLQTVFNEVEARQRFYQFPDVDFARYETGSGREQVAIGVREFTAEGLPENSRTWQTVHLNPNATRGLGAVVTPSAEKQRGDPVYWLSEVQPRQRHAAAPPSLELREPSIFFGETMTDYVIVGHAGRFSAAPDDLAGAAAPVPHVATGVPLSSFVRIAAFALRFGEQNLLFARELGDSSRLLFRRSIGERVRELAPFLLWDPEAQPVVHDGRIIWIMDGYTASANFPLSFQPTALGAGPLRYLRSSVKAVVDAVSGEVSMYAVDEGDPILRTYRRIFPSLIRDASALPASLAAHLRYPVLLFRAQTEVLQRYHLLQPEAFYAGQDVWELPREPANPQRERPRPSFITAPMPGSDDAEFLLLNAFIARERQNLTGILVARSDAPNYGRLVLLEMPRDDQIRGPSQITSIIEQDPVISQNLSLWRQSGRNVERGQLRMVPTDSSILYVVPLFLSAQDRGIPQLQQVIATDGTSVAMSEDLEGAIARMVGTTPTRVAASPAAADSVAGGTPAASEWRARALELMREADDRLRAGDFAGFGAAWNRLRTLLEQQPSASF